MNRIVPAVFFVAGLVAYGVFFVQRAESFALPDYHMDAMALALLGILARFVFATNADNKT